MEIASPAPASDLAQKDSPDQEDTLPRDNLIQDEQQGVPAPSGHTGAEHLEEYTQSRDARPPEGSIDSADGHMLPLILPPVPAGDSNAHVQMAMQQEAASTAADADACLAEQVT